MHPHFLHTTLRVNNLSFERNDQPLFSNLDCAVSAGELLQIRGANGSGKSTLLRMLAGFILPSDGTITWQGKSIAQQRDHYQQQLHYIGHLHGIKHSLTVHENLLLASALKGHDSHLLPSIAKKMGLLQVMHRLASSLSAGQLRRLALARLLLNSTPIWLLDEPTAALDTAGQVILQDLLTQHVLAGGIAVVALHQDLPLACPIKVLHLRDAI